MFACHKKPDSIHRVNESGPRLMQANNKTDNIIGHENAIRIPYFDNIALLLPIVYMIFPLWLYYGVCCLQYITVFVLL